MGINSSSPSMSVGVGFQDGDLPRTSAAAVSHGSAAGRGGGGGGGSSWRAFDAANNFALIASTAYESLDYDPTDGDMEREVKRRRSKASLKSMDVTRWAIAAAIGVAMGTVAFIVDFLIATLSAARFDTVLAQLDDNAVNSQKTPKLFFLPFLAILTTTAGLSLVAAVLVSYVEPLAAGSGIPELKTYLNGVNIKGLLSVKALVAKLGSLILVVSAGIVAGKEGPFVHAGGIVAGALTNWISRAFSRKLPFSHYLRNDTARRDFIAIGTAAGCAVAFGAPIGGMLFTVEEGVSFFSQRAILWRGFLATCSGVIVFHWLHMLYESPEKFLSSKMGVHRDFGLYSDDVVGISKQFWWYAWELPLFASIGAVGGLIGATFVRLNVMLTRWRRNVVPEGRKMWRVAEVVSVAMATVSICFVITYASPCRPLPSPLVRQILFDVAKSNASSVNVTLPTPPQRPEAMERRETEDRIFFGGGMYESGGVTAIDIKKAHFRPMFCPNDTYSVYGQIFFTPLSDSLKLLIHLGEMLPESRFEFDPGALVLYFLVNFVLMTWTYGIGAATGLFVPTLAVGAAYGQLAGLLVDAIVSSTNFASKVDLHSYAVVGAAAVLGGSTRMTISITVLVMETTGALQLLVPLMLTVLCAKAVGDSLSLGIYDTHIRLKGAPYLEEHDPMGHGYPEADQLTVSDVMAGSLCTLPPTPLLRDVTSLLGSCRHGAFAVVDAQGERASDDDTFDRDRGSGSLGPSSRPGRPARRTQSGNMQHRMCGSVLRSHLLHMIEKRIGVFDPEADDGTGRNMAGFPWPTTTSGLVEMLGQLDAPMTKLRDVNAALDAARLQPGELERLRIDLRPFLQPHPMLVAADAPLSRAYRLFRTMGLRHLYVTEKKPVIVGVLTRKDVMEAAGRKKWDELHDANAICSY
ncbi:chloride channel protein [Pseudoscourfieldia marina]